MTRSMLPIAMAFTLSACRGSGGGIPDLYLVYEDVSAAIPQQLAFAADNTPVLLLDPTGEMPQVYGLNDGEPVLLDETLVGEAVVSLPEGGVLLWHTAGLSVSENGQSWQAVAGEGLGAGTLSHLYAGDGAVWATVRHQLKEFGLYRTVDGGESWDTVNVFFFPDAIGDLESLVITGMDGSTLTMTYTAHSSIGVEAVSLISEDGGATTETYDASAQPRLPEGITSEGLQLGMGPTQPYGNDLMQDMTWTTNWRSTPFDEAYPLRVVGVPYMQVTGQVPWWLDRNDHLWITYEGLLRRTEHSVSESDPGRATALPGPGCEDKNRLYRNWDEQWPSADIATVENATDDTLLFYEADPNGNFVWMFELGPGETGEETIGADYFVLATDERMLCQEIKQLNAGSTSLRFD